MIYLKLGFLGSENPPFGVFSGENPHFCAKNPQNITIYFCILLDDGMDCKVDMDYYFVDKSKPVVVEQMVRYFS